MLADLVVRYADTRASQLTWQLGLPPVPALATLDVRRPGAEIQLRLLGASHQLLVRDGSGTLVCSETVACHLDGTPLPETGITTNGTHHLSTSIELLDRDDFRSRVDDLVADLSGRDDALVGRYPGDPLAVTALAVQQTPDDELGWWSWHAYPQTCELITTETRLSLRERIQCA